MKNLPVRLFKSVLSLFLAAILSSCATQHNDKPETGYVPDQETAVAIAVAVWTPIYGKKNIAAQKPYVARLINNGKVWQVYGTLPSSTPGMVVMGGTAEIEIDRATGKILRVSHGE